MGTRVLLFTGKGGVGKTTAAGATAVRCADQGLRTILLSTDPAHSLADSFDLALGAVATPVHDLLWAQQLDAQERFEETWADIQGYVREVLDWAGLDAIESEELALLPGLDEVFALADLKTYVEAGEWDVVVVDCGPTAETIRLLSLPDVLAWYMERIFPLTRKVNRVLGPVVARVSSLPVARDHVFSAARRFYDRLDGVRGILSEPTITSVRLVVNPEAMVVAEARRTHTYLSLFGYHTDAVIVNRLLPEGLSDPWFDGWKDVHARHLAAIEEGFAPLPVLRAELAPSELVGIDALRSFGDEMWTGRDAHRPQHEGPTMSVRRDGDVWILTLPLPRVDRHEVDLGRVDGELLVRVGPYRRSISLPDTLRRRAVAGAAVTADGIEVRFGAPAGSGRAPSEDGAGEAVAGVRW